MGRPHRSPEYRRRIPGIPILGKFRVARTIPPIPPPLVDPTDFSSDRYGGFGATTEVEYFPGESDPIQIEFRPDNDLLRAAPRSRLAGRRGTLPRRETGAVPQTVSNRRRAEVARSAIPTSPVPGPGGGVAVPVAAGVVAGDPVFASAVEPSAGVFVPFVERPQTVESFGFVGPQEILTPVLTEPTVGTLSNVRIEDGTGLPPVPVNDPVPAPMSSPAPSKFYSGRYGF